METAKMEQVVQETIDKHNWLTNPFEDLGLLYEECGELAREVRRLEVGRQRPDEDDSIKNYLHRDALVDHLAEEIGDILFPLVKIAKHYGVSLEYAFKLHCKKMDSRYTKKMLEEAKQRGEVEEGHD